MSNTESLESKTDARAAFRFPGFVNFQLARFSIVVATEMQAVAVGWQVYEITKRPLDLGLVGLAQFLPGMLLFLVSGHAADRFNRRNLLIVCESGFALCFGLLLAITLSGSASISAIYVVLTLRVPAAERPRPGPRPGWPNLFEGLHYIWREKLILGAISLDLFAVLLRGAVALLPVYAREILRAGPWGLGILRSAPGVGAGVMAIAIAHNPLKRRAGATMLWCVAGFGLATVLFGLSRSFLLSVAALFFCGRHGHGQRDRARHPNSGGHPG